MDYNKVVRHASLVGTVFESWGLKKNTLIGKYSIIHYSSLIRVWYWAITTLSTVGYGDFSPISNTERLVVAIIFLGGVAAFSYIMQHFIDMLMEFKNVTAENEDNLGLSKFFGLLSRFNSGHPLPKDIAKRIEEYFDYFWQKDLNYAMRSSEGIRFLSELPKKIRINVIIIWFLNSCRSIKIFYSALFLIASRLIFFC